MLFIITTPRNHIANIAIILKPKTLSLCKTKNTMRKLLIILLFTSIATFAQSGKYKVNWTIKEAVQIPCPNAIIEDEFGRKTNGNYSTMAYCTQDIRIEKTKEFDNKKEAKDFFDRLVKEKDSQFQLQSQFIESVSIEKY